MKNCIILIILLFSAPLFADTCDDDMASLLWLETADVKLDAKKSLENGDTKLMAVYGFALYIPGVTDEEKVKALEAYNFKAIKGTSDVHCSERHGELVIKAYDYATFYNKIMTSKSE